MPVGMIARITTLTSKRVRECLFVMIQHNVAVYAETQEKTRIVTYYEINRTELLNRALIPKVLHSSQKWFDSDGATIAQTMLVHGKLTITECTNDIVARATYDKRSTAQRSVLSALRLFVFVHCARRVILIEIHTLFYYYYFY